MKTTQIIKITITNGQMSVQSPAKMEMKDFYRHCLTATLTTLIDGTGLSKEDATERMIESLKKI